MDRLHGVLHGLIVSYIDYRAAWSLISLNYSAQWVSKLQALRQRPDIDRATTAYLAAIGDLPQLQLHGHSANADCWVAAMTNSHLTIAEWLWKLNVL